MTELTILLVALLAATLVGLWYRTHAGRIRPVPSREFVTGERRRKLLRDAGVGTGATLLHFSADWCGPCAAVRRVIGQVVRDIDPTTGPVIEVEVNIDHNPVLAKELGVFSLPTTFIFDDAATERFRISGIPSAADLHSALATLKP